MRDAFIAAHQHVWPVAVLCQGLGVSRGGFYAYLRRPARADVDAEAVALVARVKAIAEATRGSYGSRRMAKQLQAEGFHVGRAKARRLMTEAGVTVRRPRRRGPVTTDSRHGYEVAPNLLARQFTVAAPDQVWAGDITSIWTAEGWLYLAVLLDMYSRKVVGWAMSEHIDTTLVQDALQMALWRRQPAVGLLHHSDRDRQYASHAYRDMLVDHGIVCSMSGKGECLDHAVAERFFGSLKHVDLTALLRHASRGERRYHRLHRNVLQQQTEAFVSRVCQSQ